MEHFTVQSPEPGRGRGDSFDSALSHPVTSSRQSIALLHLAHAGVDSVRQGWIISRMTQYEESARQTPNIAVSETVPGPEYTS